MKKLNRKNTNLEKKLPIKILQFGEGNFLRAFVDFAFHQLNEDLDFNAGIAVVQPIENGMIKLLRQQEGLYTLFMKGIVNGQESQEKVLVSSIVDCINPYEEFDNYLSLAITPTLEFIISNTTEAGISYVATDSIDSRPPQSFPAKLTLFLYRRFVHFNGDPDKGLTIIPCELINYNADKLKNIILQYVDQWKLDEAFKSWVLESNSFHNTLVDRIVPGYPKNDIENYNKQLDYEDQLIVNAELFFLWVIEGDDELQKKLPFNKTPLDIKIVEDMQPYRNRKVRILNGAHTIMVPLSLLYGNLTVKESIENQFTSKFIQKVVFDEIIPVVDMDKEELKKFAEDVFDRFRNPFIRHELSSIALNSISKFKVRVLPSLIEYHDKFQKLPVHLTFSFACLIRFYKGEWQESSLPINDDPEIISIINKIWESNNYESIAQEFLGKTSFWDQDLNEINGLSHAIGTALKCIDSLGIEKGFEEFQLSVSSTNQV